VGSSQTLLTSVSSTPPDRCDSLTILSSTPRNWWEKSHKHIEYTSQQLEMVSQACRVHLPTGEDNLTNLSSTFSKRRSKLTNLSKTPHNRWGYSHKPIEYTSQQQGGGIQPLIAFSVGNSTIRHTIADTKYPEKYKKKCRKHLI